MDCFIPSRRKGFCVMELCHFCSARLVITDQRIILNNEPITCKVCKKTFTLDINTIKES